MSADELAASARIFLQLLVEHNRSKTAVDTDARIFAVLSRLAKSEGTLRNVANLLKDQEQRRSDEIKKVRIVTFIHDLQEKWGDFTSVDADAVVKDVRDVAHWCGLEISEEEAHKVIAKAKPQNKLERPAFRMFEVLGKGLASETTVREMLSLLKELDAGGATDKAKASFPQRLGKFKSPNDLSIYRHEREGGTEILKYVLRVIANDAPWAADAALTAWSAAWTAGAPVLGTDDVSVVDKTDE